MKQEEQWLWDHSWGGRTVTSKVHCSEEEAKRRYPGGATKVERSRRLVDVPETEEEREAIARSASRKPSPSGP